MAPGRWWAAGRWTLPLLVVVPMLGLADALGTHAIIFPEGAALAMGVWAVGAPGWIVSPGRILLLPPLCAVAGVVLTRSAMPVWAAELLALTLTLALLAAADSRLAPAISAGILPIVFGVDEWSYPLAVAVICIVVVAGMPWLTPRADAAAAAPPTGRYPWRVAAGGWLVIAAWIVVAGQALELSSAVLAPPLFVAALEWLSRGGCSLAGLVPRLALLVGAGLAGSLALAALPAAWLAGALAVVVTLALMRALETVVAPALAIALIPQIVGHPDPATFTVQIAVGATGLFVGMLAVSARWPAMRGGGLRVPS